MKADVFSTPLGDMTAVGTDEVLVSVGFFPPAGIPRGKTGMTQKIQEEMAAYFAGELQAFTTPLDLSGPFFFNLVWRKLHAVPFGALVSYGELAELAGNPKAYRAAAQACAQNRFLIIVPCHRVIAKSGGIGGFNAGLKRKEWLLNFEDSHC